MANIVEKLSKRLLGDAGRQPPASLANNSLEHRLEAASAAWKRHLQPLADPLGVVKLPAYPILPEHSLANCRVFPLREHILSMMPKSGRVAEVGVQAGEFSRTILEVCRPQVLELIDIDTQRFKLTEQFSAEIEAGVVNVHERDSAQKISEYPDAYFDFIYIDADHAYAGVKRDIAAAYPKVRPGGYLLFNDYTFWSSGECIPYGVMQAVNEFILEHGWEVACYAFGHYGYADIGLRSPASAA